MRQILFVLLPCLVLLSSCNRQNLTTTKDNPAASHDETATFNKIQCDNEADLVCGMSLTAGVGDTVHYENKVFGFCSKGCKDKFVKNPTKYIAAK
jgi:YHS domain-containing protein